MRQFRRAGGCQVLISAMTFVSSDVQEMLASPEDMLSRLRNLNFHSITPSQVASQTATSVSYVRMRLIRPHACDLMRPYARLLLMRTEAFARMLHMLHCFIAFEASA